MAYTDPVLGYQVLDSNTPPVQGLYEQSSTKKDSLGRKVVLEDGRVFRYMKNGGTALVAGTLLQAKAAANGFTKTGLLSLDDAIAVGDTTVNLTVAAALSSIVMGAATTLITENTFADGYFYVSKTTATGEGNMYKIKAQKAETAVTAMTISLYDPIRVACTTTAGATAVGLVLSPYSGVVVSPVASATRTGPVVGVAPIAVTANYYFWGQTYGPAIVKWAGGANAANNEGSAEGDAIVPSIYTTAGAGTVQSAWYTQAAASSTSVKQYDQIGRLLGAVATTYAGGTYWVPVFLTIAA